jgi:hypothetical protein
MSTPRTILLTLGAVALVVGAAGLVGPPLTTRGGDGADGSAAPAACDAAFPPPVFELLLFGSSLDRLRLDGDTAPQLVYRVPAGYQLSLTDVDSTSGGLVVWRRSQQTLVQVGFVVDRGSVGRGQSSRSYATGIPFEPGDELLVQAAAGNVEWAALRGVVRPARVVVTAP